jgi:uncharacterized protein with PCYCGC motif
MKHRILFALIAVLALGAGSLLLIQSREKTSRQEDLNAALFGPASPAPKTVHDHSARVPAYQSASEINKLAPTLPAGGFIGKTREAYSVAKKIPQTLAQLPCYCECDRGFGHKSLHTCFVDDHASHCAVCVDEALLAYKLQNEEKLTAEQVRERIIAQYSGAHTDH